MHSRHVCFFRQLEEVRVARTGTEALEAARAYQLEVVLADIGLPEADGLRSGAGLVREARFDHLQDVGQQRAVPSVLTRCAGASKRKDKAGYFPLLGGLLPKTRHDIGQEKRRGA
jgi:CheY-like chemotaxis protein